MGGNFNHNITAWTLLCFVILLRTVTAETDLVQDLGLNLFPDASKINISLEEYTNMMRVYLAAKENSAEAQSIPKLITFNLERSDWWQKEDSIVRLKFPITKTENEVDVESAQLRLLLPPQIDKRTKIQVQTYQILGKRRRRFLQDTYLYLSANYSKWCEIDVTSAVKNWFDGERNLGVELVCVDCPTSIYPQEAAITALIHPESRRSKRSSFTAPERPTDCRGGPGKVKCCRHKMTVVLKDVLSTFPGSNSIMMPKSYDAGFCQGICPKNYNHATNHSRIQSLMHQLDRKNRGRNSKVKLIPKACCAPTKLKSLQILRVNPDKPNKLIVENWNNMEVQECSCS